MIASSDEVRQVSRRMSNLESQFPQPDVARRHHLSRGGGHKARQTEGRAAKLTPINMSRSMSELPICTVRHDTSGGRRDKNGGDLDARSGGWGRGAGDGASSMPRWARQSSMREGKRHARAALDEWVGPREAPCESVAVSFSVRMQQDTANGEALAHPGVANWAEAKASGTGNVQWGEQGAAKGETDCTEQMAATSRTDSANDGREASASRGTVGRQQEASLADMHTEHDGRVDGACGASHGEGGDWAENDKAGVVGFCKAEADANGKGNPVMLQCRSLSDTARDSHVDGPSARGAPPGGQEEGEGSGVSGSGGRSCSSGEGVGGAWLNKESANGGSNGPVMLQWRGLSDNTFGNHVGGLNVRTAVPEDGAENRKAGHAEARKVVGVSGKGSPVVLQWGGLSDTAPHTGQAWPVWGRHA